MKYVVFDGNNFAHISFHKADAIIKKNPTENSDLVGMTLLVFFRKFYKYLKKFNDSSIIVTWDARGSSLWRKSIFPEYKSDRKYSEDSKFESLFKAMDTIKIILKDHPVVQLEKENLEADDIIYKIASYGDETVILSSDSDLIQIIEQFPNSRIYHPLKDVFLKKPDGYNYIVYKAIKGDKSDQIPGLNGYGEVKAEKLAKQIFTDEAVLNEEQKEILDRNMLIMSIQNNPHLANYSLDLAKIKNDTINLNNIRKHFYENKLISLLNSFEDVVDLFS